MGAGAAIIAMHHEQDIKKMGALKEKMPVLFYIMLIATLAISGFAPLSGFVSKDAIINHIFYTQEYLLFGIAIITAILTSYYMFRLLFIVFIAPSNKDESTQKLSGLIYLSLILLTIGVIFAGGLNLNAFFGGSELFSAFLSSQENTAHLSHTTELTLLIINTMAAVLGLIFALHYRSTKEDKKIPLFDNMIHNRFYVDALYHVLFVQPLQKISSFVSESIDKQLIDRSIHTLSYGYQKLSYYTDYIQNGKVRLYALYITIAMAMTFIYVGVMA